jgi:outer membrane receptor protein involved in Fe transport
MAIDLPPAPVAEVVVRAARLPPAASQAAFSVIRLDGEVVQERQRLDQALTEAPGASLFRRNDSLAANPTTQGITLRSLAPSGAGRALVTLDGVPQGDPFGGWVIWASLPTQLIDDVTIVRGGGAGAYGAGALTGVIDLSERATPGIAAEARAGSFDTARGTFVGETDLGGNDVLLGLSGGRSDGYFPVRNGAGSVDERLSESDWSGVARVTRDLADGRLAARLSYFDEERGSGVTGASARARGGTASLTLAASPVDGRRGYRLQGWVKTSDLYNASASIVDPARSVSRVTNEQYRTPSVGAGLNAALRGGDASHEWELGGDLRYASGETRERLYTAGSPTGSRIAGGETLTGGVYGEATRKYGDLLATGALRVDYWSTSGATRADTSLATGAALPNTPTPAPDADGVTPSVRLGLRRDFGDAYLRTAAYTAFRAPSLNELHRPFNVGAVRTESNGALKPEKLAGAEVGAGLKRGAVSADVTLFYNELDDAITNVTITPTLRQRQNAGTVEAFGVEAETAWKPSSSLAFRLAAAWTDATTEADLRPAQAPEVTVTARAAWTPIAPLTLEARARYEGERFEDDLNTLELAASTVVDLRAGWRLNARSEVYLAADNVFDEDVETGQSFGLTNYGAPRLVSVGITYRR